MTLWNMDQGFFLTRRKFLFRCRNYCGLTFNKLSLSDLAPENIMLAL